MNTFLCTVILAAITPAQAESVVRAYFDAFTRYDIRTAMGLVPEQARFTLKVDPVEVGAFAYVFVSGVKPLRKTEGPDGEGLLVEVSGVRAERRAIFGCATHSAPPRCLRTSALEPVRVRMLIVESGEELQVMPMRFMALAQEQITRGTVHEDVHAPWRRARLQAYRAHFREDPIVGAVNVESVTGSVSSAFGPSHAGALAGLGDGAHGGGTSERRAAVQVGAPTVSGALDAQRVFDRMKRYRPTLELCYRKILAEETLAPRGRYTLSFSIRNDGTVDLARLSGGNTRSSLLETCVTLISKDWRFMENSPGNVRVPLHFMLRD